MNSWSQSFTCQQCNRCCRGPLEISFSAEEQRKFSRDFPEIKPKYKKKNSTGGSIYLIELKSPQDTCPFHDGQGCIQHKKFGFEYKSACCKSFPFAKIPTQEFTASLAEVSAGQAEPLYRPSSLCPTIATQIEERAFPLNNVPTLSRSIEKLNVLKMFQAPFGIWALACHNFWGKEFPGIQVKNSSRIEYFEFMQTMWAEVNESQSSLWWLLFDFLGLKRFFKEELGLGLLAAWKLFVFNAKNNQAFNICLSSTEQKEMASYAQNWLSMKLEYGVLHHAWEPEARVLYLLSLCRWAWFLTCVRLAQSKVNSKKPKIIPLALRFPLDPLVCYQEILGELDQTFLEGRGGNFSILEKLLWNRLSQKTCFACEMLKTGPLSMLLQTAFSDSANSATAQGQTSPKQVKAKETQLNRDL